MFDQFLLMINEWMMAGFGLAVVGCFLWGLVSVLFSPCHLASIPLMVGYVAGQGTLVQGRQAAGYAVLFSMGLFVSIALVGIICSMLGRMLGDISPLWGIPVGGLFIWLGLNLIGIKACKLPSGSLGNYSWSCFMRQVCGKNKMERFVVYAAFLSSPFRGSGPLWRWMPLYTSSGV